MKFRENRFLLLSIFQSGFFMRRPSVHSVIIVLLASLLSFSSVATEVNGVDTDKYLLSSCNAFKTTSDKDRTLPCIMYIKGFFNGLLNAEKANVSKIDEQNTKTSNLVERAYSNRVGRLAQREPLNRSCITVDELKGLILESLSNDKANTFLSVKQFNSFLIQTLTTACSSGNRSN